MKTINIKELELFIKSTRSISEKNRAKAIIRSINIENKQEIANDYSVSVRSIQSWIHNYLQSGTIALKDNQGGRPVGTNKWSDEIFIELCKEIDKGGKYWSIPIMSAWIQEKYQTDIPLGTIWYRISHNNYTFKSARPHPMLGNKEKQELFKKGVLVKTLSKKNL